jgi:hypothetical protein
VVLAAAFFAVAGCGAGANPALVASRGGVVDRGHAPYSEQALLAALAARFDMVELSVRFTEDRELVVLGQERVPARQDGRLLVSKLTLGELQTALESGDGNVPLLLGEALELCAGRSEVMLKYDSALRQESLVRVREALRSQSLLEGAFILSTEMDADPSFWTPAAVGVRGRWYLRTQGSRAAQRTDRGNRFLIEPAKSLDARMVEAAGRLGEPIVASVLVEHYRDEFDHRKAARKDIERAKKLGATHLYVDAIYVDLPPSMDAVPRR